MTSRLLKRLISGALALTLVFSINGFAAVVTDSDGSAFITKAEFDSLKNSFQAQIDSYNQAIDSKIDGAIAAYLAGVKIATSERLENLYVALNGVVVSNTDENNTLGLRWYAPDSPEVKMLVHNQLYGYPLVNVKTIHAAVTETFKNLHDIWWRPIIEWNATLPQNQQLIYVKDSNERLKCGAVGGAHLCGESLYQRVAMFNNWDCGSDGHLQLPQNWGFYTAGTRNAAKNDWLDEEDTSLIPEGAVNAKMIARTAYDGDGLNKEVTNIWYRIANISSENNYFPMFPKPIECVAYNDLYATQGRKYRWRMSGTQMHVNSLYCGYRSGWCLYRPETVDEFLRLHPANTEAMPADCPGLIFDGYVNGWPNDTTVLGNTRENYLSHSYGKLRGIDFYDKSKGMSAVKHIDLNEDNYADTASVGAGKWKIYGRSKADLKNNQLYVARVPVPGIWYLDSVNMLENENSHRYITLNNKVCDLMFGAPVCEVKERGDLQFTCKTSEDAWVCFYTTDSLANSKSSSGESAWGEASTPYTLTASWQGEDFTNKTYASTSKSISMSKDVEKTINLNGVDANKVLFVRCFPKLNTKSCTIEVGNINEKLEQ